MRILGGVAAAVLSAAALADTPPRPAVQVPARIPAVAAELLRLEVSVTGPDGRPVPGLTVGDFQILEDGRPEEITHFRPGRGVAAGGSGAADAAPGDDEGTAGRHIVLAIDDLHLSAASLTGCKEALKLFLTTQVTDDDEVALVTTSGGRGSYLGFTHERVMLRRAIDRLAYAERRGDAGGRATLSEHQAEAIDRGDTAAMDLATREISLRDLISGPVQSMAGGGQFVNPRVDLEARSMARSIVAQAVETTNHTLGVLEAVVRGLGAAPGRKLLVLVSDGFLTGQGSQNPLAFDIRRIYDASARAGVSVYALHSRGLSAEPSAGSADKPPNVDQAAPAIRDGYRTAGALAERENLGALAEGTGGFLVHGTNDLSVALETILRDSDSAYLLAYSPSSTARDGRFRRIQVKLPGHPRLSVRSRHGYFAPDDRQPAAAAQAVSADESRENDLRRALGSLVPLRGVPLDMALDFVDLPPHGPQAVVRARVDLGGLPLVMRGDRRQGELEVLGVVHDEAGQVVGEVEGHRVELDLSPATYQQLLRDGLRFQRSVPLRPGSYQVRLVARERLSAQVGTAFQWIEVPVRTPSGVTLSSVFLFTDKDPTGPVAAPSSLDGLLDVQVLRRFPQGGSLYYGLYVYDAARDAAGSTDVVLQAQVWSAGRLQGVSAVQAVPSADGGTKPAIGRVVLEGLTPGEYELRVLVVDRKANVNAQRRTTFTIG